ncbi:MAG: hypothetical protein FVQ82_14205 [Planctomycetes bacterium]|nr:hypothetical protein [Planctomycetota bacterium]
MKKATPVLIVIAAVALWWFLQSGENHRTGAVNTSLPDKIDTIRADHISCIVLDSKFGIAQGFDVYDDAFADNGEMTAIAERNGAETTDNAIKWLTGNRDKKKHVHSLLRPSYILYAA